MPEFYVIFARKIIEMPELFIIFAQKLTKKSRFNHDICPKNIYLYSLHGAAEADIFLYFPDFFGGGREVGRARAPPPCPLTPVSYAYAKRWQSCRLSLASKQHLTSTKPV